ncbi:hypothetical protein A2524_01100 [Candidatus Wolfebacteria bacterium RIFOXYD12_FULL_48_21]|uniref:General secretion pathway GspH domain-containing protein n=1 Tax=Candidatus Wolfebacteria bacterium RIFOXYD1_FULL_48_65 TaxID=1802561 RepID=A0A1F8E0B6_9BACT|nr:MAG: hypothetical protein A2610_03045 [Candidatus Wolfebacteria bacterium RIFOXYD1_FULL_48_65]OGM94406.1 MAG: hypothetical protein A2524_01100 [Candidatus Wolfebacteria bacterium RIFOXYD12_FULL_48_21]OGM97611.1 MAG: hypothetical protein A2532_00090 [Candidatus Wolfebacteria bacterium RIFOXYD2_FULL_48_11]
MMNGKRVEKHAAMRGFTLIETLVVMSLVLILISIAAMYNRNAGRQVLVAREHAKVLTTFVRARSAGLTIPKTDPSVERICAYGVHVDSAARTIILFKDLGEPLPGSCVSANHIYDGDSEALERSVLDATVNMAATNIQDVVFIPPSGEVIITNEGGTVVQSATVTVAGVESGLSRGVKINTFGQITEFEPIP